jgi:oligopeptide transport system substrate-binding protein
MKGWGLLAALVVADLLLSACTRPTPMVKEVVKEVTQEVKVEVTREVVKEVVVTPTPVFRKVLRLNMGVGDVPTIDPALSTERSSVQIAEETTVGLTRQNEETAAIEPGMATRWDISEDGKTYTFHLRTDVPWVRYNAATGQVEKVKDEQGKDRMVLCKDFAYGIKRTLSPKTGSEYAYVLTTHIVGAEEFNTTDTARLSKEDLKKLEDGVGVTCKDDATLEITIK